MKKSSNSLFSQINAEAFQSLTSTVNETLFTGNAVSTNKTFTSADLWNIQRNTKMRIQRRFSL